MTKATQSKLVSAIASKKPSGNVVPLVSKALGLVADAARNEMNSRADAAKAVKAACAPIKQGNAMFEARTKACRGEYIAGALSAILGITVDAARKVASNAGHGGKGKVKQGQGRRNKAQETAYTAARKRWSDISRMAGVNVASNSANNINAPSKDERAPQMAGSSDKTATQKPDAKPTPVTRETVDAHVLKTAMDLFAYLNKYAKVATPKTSSIVQDFHTAAKIGISLPDLPIG